MRVEERLMRYVQFETTSDPNSTTVPSTSVQKDFAEVLAAEMREMGLVNVRVSETGYVYGTLKGNTSKKVPSFGLIAHMDTAPDYSGKDVKPRLICNYDGSDVWLSDSVVTKVEEFPAMKKYIGKDIIVTDGSTLLGADDKAGIAEVNTALNCTVTNSRNFIKRINNLSFTLCKCINYCLKSFTMGRHCSFSTVNSAVCRLVSDNTAHTDSFT